jgi:hypothetical protein
VNQDAGFDRYEVIWQYATGSINYATGTPYESSRDYYKVFQSFDDAVLFAIDKIDKSKALSSSLRVIYIYDIQSNRVVRYFDL